MIYSVNEVVFIDLIDAALFITLISSINQSVNLYFQNGGDMKGAMKDLVSEAERLEIKDKAPLVFCERIFNSKILNQIKEHRLLLLRYVSTTSTLCGDVEAAGKCAASGASASKL